MAITIKKTGYCRDCPEAELELEEIYGKSFDADSNDLWDWIIHCKHEEACERMFKGRYKNATEEI